MIHPATLVQVAIDYRPSLQTQHLGLFGTMTVVALVAAVWVFRTRRTRGARLFAATLLLVGLRTGSDVLHGLVGELWTFQAFLVAANPLLELCTLLVFVRFAGRYSGVQWLRDERATWAMAGVVVAAATAIATNPVHGLVFTSFHRIWLPFTHVGVDRGVLGLVLFAVNGALLLVGAGLLAHACTAGKRPAWWPSAVLSIAVSQALLVGWLEFDGGGVLPRYQYHAIALGGFVFLTTLALFDHGLRRIEVVARTAILDEIEDAVVFLDPDGSVVDWNAASTGLFRDVDAGEPFTERFPGQLRLGSNATTTEITIDSPEGVHNSSQRVSGSREDGDDPRKSNHGDTGQHFLVHCTPVRSETGRLLGYTVRFVDVTELKRRSRELQRKNDKLDQFASTVSHDLRNPLTVASGYLEMVSETVDSSDGEGEVDIERALAHLDKIQVSLDRMNVIIEDILALIENADPVTDTRSVDFGAVTTAAWETVDTGAASLHVASTGHVEADPERLQRLLENLFRNAIDHVGEDVAIETGLTEAGFYVADDGPGIPESDRDRIFEHGYTTGDDGTGLGLAIVEQLAEVHGWEITLDPAHEGARFVVSGCETIVASDATSRVE